MPFRFFHVGVNIVRPFFGYSYVFVNVWASCAVRVHMSSNTKYGRTICAPTFFRL